MSTFDGPDLVARSRMWTAALGLTTPWRRDVALAAAIAGVTVGLWALVVRADAGVTGLSLAPWQVATVPVLLVAQALAVALRRVAPVGCVASIVVLQVVLSGVVAPPDVVRGVAASVALYTCGVRLPTRRALTVAGAAVTVEWLGYVASTLSRPPMPGSAGSLVVVELFGVVVLHLAATVLGAYVGTRRRYVELARLRAADAVEAHRARADAAVAAERTRMARELHDIAAHHLSAMVIQMSMVERLVARDPAAAARHAAQARAQGRRTLEDLRSVVGALRGPADTDGDRVADGSPVPGLAELGRLVSSVDGATGPVTLAVSGGPRDLPPIADVGSYRIVQEALANARDHAPGAPVTVTVDHTAVATSIEVRNGPSSQPAAAPAAGRGFGLVGMRERAAAMGADLEVGPVPGGWRVRVTLPVPGTGGSAG